MAESILSGLNQETTQALALVALQALAGTLRQEDTPHMSGDTGQAVFGIRSDSDGPTADDGDYTILKLDEQGRLKVSTKPASFADATGDITAIQASIDTPVAGGAVEANVEYASNVMAFCTGTFSGANCTFEGSLESEGNANWFAIQAARSNANTIELVTGALSAQPAYAWEMSVNGLRRVRVRCTALTSGSQSWRFVLGTYATEPIPSLQTHAVSGTVTANVGGVAPALYADSTTVLAANAVFTGTSRDGGAAYQHFCARAYASHDGTLEIQDSTNASTWRQVDAVAVAAGETKTLRCDTLARYHRVVYTNGGMPQTAFSLTSRYGRI